MSQQRQLTHSTRDRELRTRITKSEWNSYIDDGPRSAVSIFIVPEFLKNTKKEAYVPQRVSLGLYHHGSAELPPMGHHKGKALRTMMKICNANAKDHKDFGCHGVDKENVYFANKATSTIKKLKKQIMDCYEENINCDEENLARMLCLDGWFLLQVLTVLSGDKSLGADIDLSMLLKENEIIVFASRDIVNDILMLENQVPFFVLRTLLHELGLNSTNVNDLLFKMVMGCIRRLLIPDYILSHMEKWCEEKLAREEEVQHLLSFLYDAIVEIGFGPIEDTDGGPTEDNRGPACSIFIDCSGRCIMQHQDGSNKAPKHFQRIRPAVELRYAGIKFEPCHGSIKNIKFDRKSATIFLPPICITGNTEVLFRNFIAFEVRRGSEIKYVSCYVNIMDNLIESQKDVALLRRMGVLTNWLGRDNEVVDLFNGLSKATDPVNLFDAFYQLTKRVNAHYEKEIRVQLQLPKLVQDYCSTPWKALASAAAIVLLLLTLLQTIFSGTAVIYK